MSQGGPPRRALAQPSWDLFRPLAAPGLTSIYFFAPQGHSKNRPIFGTSQNRPRGWQSRPLAALWPPMAPFCMFFGSILRAIFHHFSILFRTPQNLEFAIPYVTFEGFKHPKSSHFGTPFRSPFLPHFGTPFGRAFWRFLAPQGADLASPCRFWNIFGTPLGSKMGP